MEQYVKVIKKRIGWLLAAMLLIVAVGMIRVFVLPLEGSMMVEFQYGLLIGLEIMAMFWEVHYRKILKSERLLQQEYNRERDERLKTIRAKAGLPFTLFSSVSMLLAGSVIGYYNLTVFYTLTAAACVQIVLSSLVKMYYMKTM